jgi:hypothetical protein
MYKKKLLTLMMASLLPLSTVIIAEDAIEAAGGPPSDSGPVGTAEVSEESAAVEPAQVIQATEAEVAPEAAVQAEGQPQAKQEESTPPQAAEQSEPAGGAADVAETDTTGDPLPKAEAASPDEAEYGYAQRWKDREARYQALKQRAEEAGVMLPVRPPWRSSPMEAVRPSMEERMEHRQKMMNMSPEERDAFRLGRYQEMRERAHDQGMEMPERPPWMARREAREDEWAKHQAAIDGMSDEERAACHAMHRRHMGMGRGMGPGHGCAQGCQRPYRYPAGGQASGYPGYGYGYAPYGAPYGQGNFWDPNY